jgi:hypothetical protein
MKLTKGQLARIAKEAKKVKEGDLYTHLHHVGDDPVKSEIEWALEQILSKKDFAKTVAVFKIATEW